MLSKRGKAHLKVERSVLERAAKAGSPFLCSLRYAFRAGSWFVLALPMLSGGTLQVRLEEATTAGSGLPLDQVTWFAAQLGLALEAVHCLGMIHRDVKPSNVLIGADGYLQAGAAPSPTRCNCHGIAPRIAHTAQRATTRFVPLPCLMLHRSALCAPPMAQQKRRHSPSSPTRTLLRSFLTLA